MARIVMVYIVMACIVMACIVMANSSDFDVCPYKLGRDGDVADRVDEVVVRRDGTPEAVRYREEAVIVLLT